MERRGRRIRTKGLHFHTSQYLPTHNNTHALTYITQSTNRPTPSATWPWRGTSPTCTATSRTPNMGTKRSVNCLHVFRCVFAYTHTLLETVPDLLSHPHPHSSPQPSTNPYTHTLPKRIQAAYDATFLKHYVAAAREFEPIIPPELTAYIVNEYVALRSVRTDCVEAFL